MTSMTIWGSPAALLASMPDRELLRVTDTCFSLLDSDFPDAECRQWYELAVEEAQRRRLAPPRRGFIGAGASRFRRSRPSMRLRRRTARE